MEESLIEDIGKKMYSLFFNRNFGLATKSEIEGALFNIYMNDKKNKGEDYSDRYLSRELGISEARVKNLKRTSYARYEDEINFPKLLISLSDRELDLMFFNISSIDQKVFCKITVTEIVYYDELCAQLTNNKIQFDKKIGSNYVELSMFDAINFFDKSSIHEENEQLLELIAQMKTIDFKNAGADVIKGIVKDTKFANTIMAFWKLAKNSK